MNLIFERGDRNTPAGHALIYFEANDGAILATYVTVPPIQFDVAKFMPPALSSMLGGMDMSEMVSPVFAIPPLPEEVQSREYLHALAERRADDVICAGGTMRTDPMRLMSEAQEAAGRYAELYNASPQVQPVDAPTQPIDEEVAGYDAMSDLDKINQLSGLTGRLRDSLQSGNPSSDIVSHMEHIASRLPPKYRGWDLISAAGTPGPHGQRLAELYLERSYTLYREEYLDLERLDREIEETRARL